MTKTQSKLATLIRQIEAGPPYRKISLFVETGLLEKGALPPDWRRLTEHLLPTPPPPKPPLLLEEGGLTPDWRYLRDLPPTPPPRKPPLGHSGWGEAAMDCDPEPAPHGPQEHP